jgi:signal transduction histidine kinase/ActR/RegA family two-component response regulator
MKLRSHLSLLVAGAVVPVLLLAITAGVILVRHDRANIERDAIGRTRAAMSAIDAELRGAVSTLEALATSEHLKIGDMRAFQADSRRVLATQPRWLGVRLTRAASAEVFDIVASPPGGPASTAPDDDTLARAIRTGRPAIGDVAVAPAGDGATISISVPVGRGGRVTHVLTVPLDVELFAEMLRDQQLPGEWVIALVDRRRRFVSRLPRLPAGDPISTSFDAAIARAPVGFFRGRTTDGRDTFTPYVTSPLTGWVLGIGMPEGVVTAGATRLATTIAAGVAVALCVALWLAWLVARRVVTPITALAGAASAIASGERPEVRLRSRVDELTDVARALDGASAAVRAREAELVSSSARFESLAAVARTLNTLDLDATLNNVVETACTLLQAEVATLFRLDPESRDLILLSGGGARGATLNHNLVLARGTGLVGLAVERQAVVVSDDILRDPRITYDPEMRARIEAARHRAGAAVPLVVQGRITGALFVGAMPGRSFTAEEMRLVTTFADQAAVAMANAELYRDTERANRAKDEFLAMLGHELRNPLGAIATAASVLHEVATPDVRVVRAHAVIERQVRHLSRLVDDLLDVGRVTTGKIVLARRPVNLGTAVADLVRAWRGAGRLDRHHVTDEPTEAWVDADDTRLEQIVANLLGNALKYTPAGGAIAVRVALESGHAILRVEDSGIGIAPHLIGRVFDLFVQGDTSLDRAQAGLGIGLTLVRRLVEMHGGTVVASSAGAGRGSTFTVGLPSIPAPGSLAESSRRPEHDGARRVLVVEDSDDAREMLKILLERRGHAVHTAADGAEGLDLAIALAPEIAVIDLGLPGLDGFEVARRLRATEVGQSMTLIALTGYGQADDRRRAEEAGFDIHLVKPVDAATLEELIVSAGAQYRNSAR